MDYELIEDDERDAYDPTPFLSYARLRSTDKAERDPVVGDVVHWWDEEAARCRAAIVTQNDLQTVELTVWPPGEGFRSARAREVEHDEARGENTWHWACGEGQ